jgi:hypothetical protein
MNTPNTVYTGRFFAFDWRDAHYFAQLDEAQVDAAPTAQPTKHGARESAAGLRCVPPGTDLNSILYVETNAASELTSQAIDDLKRLRTRCVTNNGSNNVGGGGTPRAPLAHRWGHRHSADTRGVQISGSC